MGPGYVSRVNRKDVVAPTKIFFALQMRHARFRTLPSACTTSGANSIPNLRVIST
jgi:hypothetical protein